MAASAAFNSSFNLLRFLLFSTLYAESRSSSARKDRPSPAIRADRPRQPRLHLHHPALYSMLASPFFGFKHGRHRVKSREETGVAFCAINQGCGAGLSAE